MPLRRQLPAALSEKLFGMRGYPGGYAKEDGLDASRVTQILIFLSRPAEDCSFQLGPISAEGGREPEAWLSMPPEKFFPMIDRFGQFVHKDWPGKTRSEEDLAAAIESEEADAAAHPGPADWNKYGGWKSGPKLKATGFFYPAVHEGKWWLVDPEGCLFWSHGPDCVGSSQGTTPITDREFYFAGLPAEGEPLAVFYGRGSWAPHGYYKDKGAYRTYNFTGANLARKHGEGWSEKAAEAAKGLKCVSKPFDAGIARVAAGRDDDRRGIEPAGRDHARRDERREQRPDDESRSAAAWMPAGRTCHGFPPEAARHGFAPTRRAMDCRAGPCEPVPDRPF